MKPARAVLIYRLTPLVQALLDGAAWAAALLLAVWLRQGFRLDVGAGRLGFAALSGFVLVVTGLAVGLYRRRWRFGSFDEVAALARVALLATSAMYILMARIRVRPAVVPESAPIVAGFLGLVLMAGVRYGFRLFNERRLRTDRGDTLPVLVWGAGDGGAEVIASMFRDPMQTYRPVGLIDDDRSKRRLSINGVRVLGDRRDLGPALAATGAKTLLIAIPSADTALLSELTALVLAVAPGIPVKVLPAIGERFELTTGPIASVSNIRDISESDLLGRHSVAIDLAAVAHYLRGKRVLITGAGGSIGSELSRQIHGFSPAALLLLDRDESALHGVQLSIDGRGLLDSDSLVLADIRDREAIMKVFAERRPQVVFHAAALKHLPLLERHPGEAAQSNVFGTLNVLDAAVRHGVERFVNISTDKAANPVSVLGWSKRISERICAYMANTAATGTYLSVRFGNVLGSRGSMLTSFQTQIDSGGPVTVTDAEMTRYFMTVREAVQLVVQAGAIGRPGEALVLDMGSPVRINDVARLLIGRSGKSIRIQYTGARPGEKIHEDLFGDNEVDERPFHPLLSHVTVPPLDPAALKDLDPGDGDEKIISAMANLCVFESGALPRHSGVSIRRPRVLLSPPYVGTSERRLINEAIDSNWIAPVGPAIEVFEDEMAATVGVDHAVALSSGTAALHLGLLALGVGWGDRVLVSSFTFAAAANAVAYCGAEPVFLDSERDRWQVDPELVAAELERRDRKPPSVLLATDLYGITPDYERLRTICDRYGVAILEDAAEALGTYDRGRPAGSFGAVGVLSFNGNKIITTSGGGMLVTDDAAIASRVRHLATQAREPVAHYEHRDIGFNYRMSNLLAAFGRGQLETLSDRVADRRAIDQRYRDALCDLPGVGFAPRPPGLSSNCWLPCITIDPVASGTSSERVRLALEREDIESRPLWKPMHRQPAFMTSPSRVTGVSDELFAHGLCLPTGSGLSEATQDFVIESIRACFE